jgi:hypothetical protein
MEELKKVKDTHNINVLNEMENDLKRIKQEHSLEVEKMKNFYERLVVEKTNQVNYLKN